LRLPKDGQWPSKYGLPEHLLWEEYYEKFPRDKIKVIQIKIDCGSGAHGQRRGYEEPLDGKVVLSEAEQEIVRKQTAQAIQEAVNRDPGSVPHGLRLWAATYLRPPRVPWERELQALCRNALTMARGQQDYSYGRRSRRQYKWRVIMPAMIRPDIEAAIVIDTSGSMDQKLRDAALAETEGVLKAAGQRRVPVICCDAAVHGGVQRVSKALDVQVLGGGGTDMGAGIAVAETVHAKVIVVFTDGYTPWPAEPPRNAELVIGIVGRSSEVTGWPVPAWAKRVVYISNDDEQDDL
jgi:predicted metal-dependent peptidase